MEVRADRSERKLATVLFADLVGSTALAGAQDPERTRATLERFYQLATDEIELAGGTIEKFAGDAVMAAFGVPLALEDHAERALHASLALQRRMRDAFGESLELRIGVNTGEVVVGEPREGSSFVSGDPVNVAARLEQAAGAGEILVGERTAVSVRGAFEFEEARVVEAKGKASGISARRLSRALTLMRPRGVLGLRRAFVARDDEMAVLERIYEEAASTGTPQLVTVVGDAGVGKSRLIREFWERLGGRSPEPLRRTGRCLAYGQGTTYWPLAEVLKEHLGIVETDPPSTILERLGGRRMLGMTLGLDVIGDLHPLVARDAFQDAWVAFVEELAADRPAVMLIEDIHWAEELLVDLLERVLADARCPLLLIVTARPELAERFPRWGSRADGASVVLEPLASDDAQQMLTELLGAQLPPGLAAVIERAEGNPFYVEELLATLIDRGLLERANGAWQLADLPADFSVPDSVQAVVAARMDLLEGAEKSALQAASVIGRVFWAEPIYQLVMDGEPDLRILEERDFVRRRAGSSMPGQREYAIKHALTREVAYASIPRSRRAGMHAGFARWVEQAAGSSDEVAPLLAYHYAEAVRPEDLDLAWGGREAEAAELRTHAIAWLRHAAELAMDRMEIDDAVTLLHRALDLETEPLARAALWRQAGQAAILKFDGEAFWTAMQASLELDHEPATAGEVYGELAIQTVTRRGMWMRRPTTELIDGWIEQALALAGPKSAGRAKALIARAVLTDDEAAALEASAVVAELGDAHLQVMAWFGLESVAWSQGDYRRAHELAAREIALLDTMSDPDLLVYMLSSAWGASLYVGELSEARSLAERAHRAAARLSSHHRVHGIASVVTLNAFLADWPAVRQLTTAAEAAFEANATTPCILGPETLLTIARACVHLGDEAEARRLEEVVTDFGMEDFGVRLGPVQVALATARGDRLALDRLLADWRPAGFIDPDGMIAWLNALIVLGRVTEIAAEAPAMALPGTYLEPFAVRALGYAQGDEQLMQQAARQFDAMGLGWFADETRRMVVDRSA